MTITLAMIVAGIVMVSLNAYVLLAGADFGGGVWDFFARGDRRRAQRDLISHAIAPIWEANHVWLILVIVLLFTCFPAAFSTIAIMLHIPLTLMLLGIVLRGSAFIFRSYGSEQDASQQRWGRVFAIASIVTPVLLGMCVGAVATGAVGATAASRSGAFVEQFISAVAHDLWLRRRPARARALLVSCRGVPHRRGGRHRAAGGLSHARAVGRRCGVRDRVRRARAVVDGSAHGSRRC